jgi:hypothetical protein
MAISWLEMIIFSNKLVLIIDIHNYLICLSSNKNIFYCLKLNYQPSKSVIFLHQLLMGVTNSLIDMGNYIIKYDSNEAETLVVL